MAKSPDRAPVPRRPRGRYSQHRGELPLAPYRDPDDSTHAEAMLMPPEASTQAAAAMPREAIAPAGAFLAHASCTLTGETMFVGPDHISRLAVIDTRGITAESLTAESVAERLDEIMDVTDAQIPTVGDRLT